MSLDSNTTFQPDYTHVEAVLHNRRPQRLPLYEHHIDGNILTLNNYEEVFNTVLEKGTRYRTMTRGYGIGSGNSIPDYVPVEGFRAMIDAVQKIRRDEKGS